MSTEQEDVVILTGFGPFANHPKNASWEVVKLVCAQCLEEMLRAKLIIHEIPVIYDTALTLVPDLWKTHKPTLVVHVGVSSIAECVTLETCARNVGYCRPDIQNQFPVSEQCYCKGPTHITCSLELDRIAQQVLTNTGVKVETSEDAGQYLCEFTYYLSLKEDPTATIFVHIPPLDKVNTTQQTVAAITTILREGLEQTRQLRANKLHKI